MNKYIRASVCVPFGMMKIVWTKLFHFSSFKGPKISMISPFTEITLDNGGQLEIGEKFKIRDGAKLRVRKGAFCKIGKNVSINSANVIACHERILIGNDVQFSPNVQIYDHDHDFTAEGGVKTGKYKTGSVEIGDNVWIGANSSIVGKVNIGNNVMIAPGTFINFDVPSNSIVFGNPGIIKESINATNGYIGWPVN